MRVNQFYWKKLIRVAALLVVCHAKSASQGGDLLKKEIVSTRTDLFGDCLPRQAIARMGTIRFRHPYRIEALKCLPDGKTLLSVDYHEASYWELSTGRLIYTFSGRKETERIATSPDGKLIAIGERNGTVRLFDLKQGQELATFRGHKKKISSLTFSGDGNSLASATEGAEIRIWDISSRKERMRLLGHKRWVLAAQFSPDGKTLVSGGHDETIRFWDLASGREMLSRRMAGKCIRRAAYSPNGKMLALSSSDDMIDCYDTGSYRKLTSIPVCADNLAFCPDNSLLASVNMRKIDLWNPKTGKHLGSNNNGADIAEFSTDGKYLITADNGLLRKWDASTLRHAGPTGGHLNMIHGISVSSAGNTVASLCDDNTLKFWDIRTGKESHSVQFPSKPMSSLSPDMSKLALGYDNGNIRLIDVSTQKQLFSFSDHKEAISVIKFSADGKLLVSVDEDYLIRVWDVANGKCLRTIKHKHTRRVSALAISHNRQFLAVVTMSGVLSLYDVKSGDLQRDFPIENHVYSIAFSPDDKTLAVSLFMSENGRVQLWNLDSFTLLGFLGNPGLSAFSVTFSPDGTTLAVGCDDGRVELWELITGKCIQTLHGHRGPVRAIAFVRAGDILITGGNDTTLLAWDYSLLPPEIKDKKQPIDPQRWNQLWVDLSDTSPLKAHSAMRILSAQPSKTIDFLKSRLSPITDHDLKPIQQMVARLDSDDFSSRETATKELTRLGSEATPMLRHALNSNPSLERRRRIEAVLHEPAFLRSPETIRQLRSIQILEHIATPGSRSILERLAQGSSLGIRTMHAKNALKRILSR